MTCWAEKTEMSISEGWAAGMCGERTGEVGAVQKKNFRNKHGGPFSLLLNM